MQILSTSSPAAPVAQVPPPPPQAEEPKRETTDTLTVSAPNEPVPNLDKVLDSSTISELGRKMKGGDVITISSNGEPVLEIRKESVSALAKFRQAAGTFLVKAGEEASNVIAQDPAFAFKESAFLVKDQVFSGIPDNIKTLAQDSFLPMIRVVALILDVKKATETWKKEHATRADKIIDGAHVFTDVIGLAGAVAMAFPAASSFSTILTVVGVMGDIAAYGYHITKYIQDRGAPPGRKQQQAKQAAALQQKLNQQPPTTPQPPTITPAPPPAPAPNPTQP